MTTRSHVVGRRVMGALDALTLGSALSAILLLLLGPLRMIAAGGPVSVIWTHAAFVALSATAVRHAISASPSLWSTMAGWLAAIGRRPALAEALLVWLASRPAVLAVGLAAVLTFGALPSSEQPPSPRHALRDLPARFDANWYAGIALEGYDWQHRVDRQQNVAFFPAYPLLMRAGGVLTGAFDPLLPGDRRIIRLAWAGLAVSLIAFAGAAWYFVRLAGETLEPARAGSAVMLLAAYPFAVFYSAAYTESFFLLTALATWYHARRRQHIRAGVWGLLAGLTRPNGFFLAVPLGLLALGFKDASPSAASDEAPRASPAAALAVALMPVAGMALYTLWLYQQTGVWFAWARVHAAWGRTFGAAPPGDLLATLTSGGAVSVVADHPYQTLNAIGLAFAVALLWPVARRLGVAWAAYVVVSVLPPLVAGGLLSMGRLTSTLFPLFLALAAVLPSRAVPAVTVMFALLQGLMAALFYTWRALY